MYVCNDLIYFDFKQKSHLFSIYIKHDQTSTAKTYRKTQLEKQSQNISDVI